MIRIRSLAIIPSFKATITSVNVVYGRNMTSRPLGVSRWLSLLGRHDHDQCCGAGPTLTRLRLPAPAPDNNIFVTQI